MNCEVVYLPPGISVFTHAGTTLLDAALDAGIHLPRECGGNCACTTCRVLVIDGGERLSPMEAPEDDRLVTALDRTSAMRLACQALVGGGTVVVKIVEEIE